MDGLTIENMGVIGERLHQVMEDAPEGMTILMSMSIPSPVGDGGRVAQVLAKSPEVSEIESTIVASLLHDELRDAGVTESVYAALQAYFEDATEVVTFSDGPEADDN